MERSMMKNNRLTIAANEMTSLFISQAMEIGRIKLEPSNTHVVSSQGLRVNWEVQIEKSGLYQIGICADIYENNLDAAISSNKKSTKVHMVRTTGYFKEQEINFFRYIAQDDIYLEAGEQVICFETKNIDQITFAFSSITTYPAAKKKDWEEEQRLAEHMRSQSYRFTDGFGLMFHWTSQSCPKTGKRLDYEQAVNAFDTEKFAKMLYETKASYVLFTMNHAIAHFPAPLEKWEEFFPGTTTKRDLVEDLYNSLHKRNIKLLLYLNFTAAYMEASYSGLKRNEKGEVNFLDIAPERKDDFTVKSTKMLEEIGLRYGEKVSGYWIDSCYQLTQQFGSMDFHKWYLSGKAGDAKRMVTFNYWVLPVTTPWIDCWAGETAAMVNIPETLTSDYGPAKGIPFHDLIIMEEDWGNFKENHKIINPVYGAEEIAEYVGRCNRLGAMVTINAEIYQDGSLGEETFRVLKEAGALLKEENK